MASRHMTLLKLSRTAGSVFFCLLALFVFCAFGLSEASAAESRKVALVIGNSTDTDPVAARNSIADGKLMAETLRKAGFTVIEGSDLDKAAVDKLLEQFSEAAHDADVALVYYAGHGLQVDGPNYLSVS